MPGTKASKPGSCTYDGCERDASGGDRCYWHQLEADKEPLSDKSPVEEIPDDLTGAYLIDADLSKTNSLVNLKLTDANLKDANLSEGVLESSDLSGARLGGANLSGTKLGKADLSEAQLKGANLTGAQLTDTNLTDANLYGANLSNVSANGANLTDANLRGADLTNADLRGATICGAFFRRTKISNLTLDRETMITNLHEPSSERESWQKRTPLSERQKSPEDSEPPDQKPTEWDETARGYHDLKEQFANNSLYGQARKLHIQERRARRLETKTEDGGLSRAHLAQLASGLLTGYGVGVRRITTVMILLFTISTVAYALGNITNPLTYSAITFATAPPHSVESLPTLVRFVANIETVFGTLLLVTLGFVLSNREQF